MYINFLVHGIATADINIKKNTEIVYELIKLIEVRKMQITLIFFPSFQEQETVNSEVFQLLLVTTEKHGRNKKKPRTR